MPTLRRMLPFPPAVALVIVFILLHTLDIHSLPNAKSAGSAWFDRSKFTSNISTQSHTHSPQPSSSRGPPFPHILNFSTEFHPGALKPKGNYSQLMVVPRLMDDDIAWISNELPYIDVMFYVADDPTSGLHPPRNKGHEVMVYLTYIIDHYCDLHDVIIFMHAHRWTHHNIELLDYDSAEMVRRLSNDYVAREGYVNMRCRWYPGCLEWLHPSNTSETMAKQEQVVLSRSWHELFPLEPAPEALGQACCAQFALSKNRILSIPLSRFISYRDWVLRTPLSDYVSGRIWEYLWQLIFTGKGIYCPAEHVCYCEAFGICFSTDIEYSEFEELRRRRMTLEVDLSEVEKQRATIQDKTQAGSLSSVPSSDKISNLTSQIATLDQEIRRRRQQATEQGATSRSRRNRSGRQWKQREEFQTSQR